MKKAKKVPIIVKQYLTTKEKVTKCKYFEIFTGLNDESKNQGSSNVFTIKEYNKDKDLWFVSYSTGKLDPKNPDQCMKNALILHNSNKHIIYGFETDSGFIHIYKFESGDKEPYLLVKFEK